MKNLFVGISALTLLAMPAFGKDLTEGQVIGNRSLNVPIQSLVAARIAEKKVEGSSNASNAEVAIEFTVKVEGNLCGSSPEEVSVALPLVDEDYNNLRVNLMRLRRNANPYNPSTVFCNAYSAPREVKVVVAASTFVHGSEVDRITYSLGAGENAKKVVLTHSVKNGLHLSVE